MRICIFGAGAIGAYIGAELSLAGADVTLIARGKHLKVMQDNGVTIKTEGEEIVARPRCINDPKEAGVHDYVFITLKAHSSASPYELINPLIGQETSVINAQNGLPWWYFYKLAGRWENYKIRSVDPDNLQWNKITPERVIGTVVYPAAQIISPGIIEMQPHISQKRLPIGEPNGSKSDRIIKLSKLLISAGFKSPIRSDIRSDIWMKLWGNLAFNPISALTGATLEEICVNHETRALARTMMLEGQAIGERLGAKFNIDVDTRIEGAKSVGQHKTSMLQDLELGRPMETDPILGSVAEIGKLVGVPTPTINIVYGLLKQRSSNV
tara:strand:+ start:40440 stop:41414 length:975 start_codon:yes stop_codon:yes gene_type:complete